MQKRGKKGQKYPKKKFGKKFVKKEEKKEEKTEVTGEAEEENTYGPKRGRVFIRNLIFDVNKRLLTKLLKKYGEISDINIPLNPSNNLAKGFAFVQFSSKNSALKAIKELNGTKYKGRPIELKLAVDKRMYKDPGTSKFKKKGKKSDEVEFVKEDEVEPEENKELKEDEMDELDKLVLQNIQNMNEADFEFEDEEEDDYDENGMMEEELDLSEKDGRKQQDDEEEEEEEVAEATKGQKRLRQSRGKQMQTQDEDLSCTVFIRGVPYETLQNEFEEFCKAIGEIEYAKLVRMKDGSGRHNGNGFVKFKDGTKAQKVINMTDMFDKGNFIPSLDDPDVYISGTRLKFFPAITKKTAMKKKIDRMKEIKDKQDNLLADKGTVKRKTTKKRALKTMEELIGNDKKGKRRLEYSVLGFNILGEEQQKKLKKFEVEQREEHNLEKMAKMRNPNMSVSATRVLFKNIEKYLDEEKLGRKIKLVIANDKFKGDKQKRNAFLKKKKIFKKVTILTQESADGKISSKGIAFVEFNNPTQAEEFLNLVDSFKVAKLFNKERTPIIEFAFEDVRQLRKIHNIREQRKAEEDFQERIDKPFNQIKRKEKKELEKKKEKNAQSLVNARLRDIKENPQNYGKKELMETYKMAKNRGKKQRIRKLFNKLYSELNLFGTQGPKKVKEDWDSLTKNLKNDLKGESKLVKRRPVKANNSDDELVLPNKVKKRKKKKKVKTDKLDSLAEKYIQKKQKGLKWDN